MIARSGLVLTESHFRPLAKIDSDDVPAVLQAVARRSRKGLTARGTRRWSWWPRSRRLPTPPEDRRAKTQAPSPKTQNRDFSDPANSADEDGAGQGGPARCRVRGISSQSSGLPGRPWSGRLEDVPRFQQATGNGQLFPGICELLAVAVIRAAGGGPLALWRDLGRMLTALGHELSEGCCRAETSVVDLLEELDTYEPLNAAESIHVLS